MGLHEEIANNQIILTIARKESYNQNINDLQREADSVVPKIGYVTVNRPYNTIIDDLDKNSLDKNKYYFVDAITATVHSPPIVDNCIFVNSPTDLTDLSMAYTALFNEKGCELVLFDTISTLVIYQDVSTVVKLVHNLVTKTRVSNKKAVFVALKEDSETLIKDLNMFVDKIIEL